MDCSPIILAHEAEFQIGEAHVRPATREITMNGKSAVLEPRVMQLLVALHRAGGAVVTKDELIQQCWDGRVVGEDAINRVVSRLRSVAHKLADRAFRVETITKVGYRLVSGNSSQQSNAAAKIGRRPVLVGGAAAVAATVGAVIWSRLAPQPLPKETRELIERARQAMLAAEVDETSNATAMLEKAVELSPNSAECWGLLAFSYAEQSWAAPTVERRRLLDRGTAAARHALSIDANQPDARAAKILAARKFRNWLGYEQACRDALRTNPSHANLHLLLMFLLIEVGRLAEALVHANFVAEAEPRSIVAVTAQVALQSDLGAIQDADRTIEKAFGVWPRHWAVWFTRYFHLLYSGRPIQARAMISDTASRPIGIPAWNYDLTALFADALISRDPELTMDVVSRSEEAASRGIGFAENAAVFAAYVGQSDVAFRLLEALYLNRGRKLPESWFSDEQGIYTGSERRTGILFSRPMTALRRDPRFTNLADEIGLIEYWRQTATRSKVVV